MRALYKTLVTLLLCGFFSICCTEDIEDINVREDRFKKARVKMVGEQLVARDIKDEDVLEAMKKVKRHLFVFPEDQNYAYSDRPLPIGYNQTISRPYLTALMTELAEIKKDYKVLEIGTGSGYHTAVLAEIAREVYTVEILEPLYTRAKNVLNNLDYNNIHMKLGDGYHGWKEHAPYDAIIVSAAPEREPQPLIEQLKIGGHMIIPIGEVVQELVVITKLEEEIKRERIIPVRFMPMKRENDRREEDSGD